VGGGGGEGILRLDFGAREVMGRGGGCGRVGARRAAWCHAHCHRLLIRSTRGNCGSRIVSDSRVEQQQGEEGSLMD